VTHPTRDLPVQHGTALVDLANKSVQVVHANGTHAGTWSGMTTRHVADAIRPEGWQLASGATWVVEPDGGRHDVVRLDHEALR
jgi:hypothetical protein